MPSAHPCRRTVHLGRVHRPTRPTTSPNAPSRRPTTDIQEPRRGLRPISPSPAYAPSAPRHAAAPSGHAERTDSLSPPRCPSAPRRVHPHPRLPIVCVGWTTSQAPVYDVPPPHRTHHCVGAHASAPNRGPNNRLRPHGYHRKGPPDGGGRGASPWPRGQPGTATGAGTRWSYVMHVSSGAPLWVTLGWKGR